MKGKDKGNEKCGIRVGKGVHIKDFVDNSTTGYDVGISIDDNAKVETFSGNRNSHAEATPQLRQWMAYVAAGVRLIPGVAKLLELASRLKA
jgi:hypothetical protein